MGGPGVFKPLLTKGNHCLNITGGGGPPSPADEAWNYLACTEIVHPIASNNVTDMFPPGNQPSSAAYCSPTFNVTPRVNWMPESMGIDRLEDLATQTSRLIFSNGLLDPWSSQSVTRNLSQSLVAVNIADGSHHSDLGAATNPVPTSSDSESLRAARETEVWLLKTWLVE